MPDEPMGKENRRNLATRGRWFLDFMRGLRGWLLCPFMALDGLRGGLRFLIHPLQALNAPSGAFL